MIAINQFEFDIDMLVAGNLPVALPQTVIGKKIAGLQSGRPDDGDGTEAIPGIDMLLDVAEQPARSDIAERQRTGAQLIQLPPSQL
ncbi:MAG: hypothetical protein JWM58_2060 [Rhizobium sp.]|nr:hypothetical protein [Rhizobium sp.]